MTWNPAKFIALLLCLAFWILVAFFVIGCANVGSVQEKEGWFPVGMSEDAQDYPTKYNMMDSPDGRRNPNAQVNIFGATY